MIAEPARARRTQRSTIGKKFDYLCVQEKTVPPYVRVPLHVSGCKMARLLAWSPRHIPSLFNLVLDIHVMVKWQLSKKGIRWSVPHECIAGSGIYFIEVTYFQSFRWPFFVFFYRGLRSVCLVEYSSCLLLSAKVKKCPLENFAFGLG